MYTILPVHGTIPSGSGATISVDMTINGFNKNASHYCRQPAYNPIYDRLCEAITKTHLCDPLLQSQHRSLVHSVTKPLFGQFKALCLTLASLLCPVILYSSVNTHIDSMKLHLILTLSGC
jgi:hypothetical protein